MNTENFPDYGIAIKLQTDSTFPIIIYMQLLLKCYHYNER